MSIVPDEVQIFSRINRNIYKPPVAEVGTHPNNQASVSPETWEKCFRKKQGSVGSGDFSTGHDFTLHIACDCLVLTKGSYAISKLSSKSASPPAILNFDNFSVQATKDIVRKNFTRELEFFDFCKQRLHKQYLALNLDAEKP